MTYLEFEISSKEFEQGRLCSIFSPRKMSVRGATEQIYFRVVCAELLSFACAALSSAAF